MLVVTAVMLLGLLGGITASQLGGLRLGGVVIVPLIAVYTLRSLGTFPILLMSVVGSYVSVRIVKRRLLLYGRPVFVVAVVTGGLVPLLVYLFVTAGSGPRVVVSELGFIGSVLPGIAAYNLHRLPRDKRVIDALWSLALLLFLVVVGIGLVIGVGLTPLATVAPPVLLAPESDIARAFGLVVEGSAHPTILPFPRELGLLGLGFFSRRWPGAAGGSGSGVSSCCPCWCCSSSGTPGCCPCSCSRRRSPPSVSSCSTHGHSSTGGRCSRSVSSSGC
jgi:hypothetical protein